jgi:sigma-B regulation protein RsbU (phosphoserine phosphatase)
MVDLMETIEIDRIKTQLLDRRARLDNASRHPETGVKFLTLLKEVDAALERIDNGSYGLCVVCHEPIEEDRLMVNPLITVCIGDLNESQRHSLEVDLDMAHKIQKSMLPKNNFSAQGWEAYFHYKPAGAVSGDYCDIIDFQGNQFFLLGDVSGKGIPASMLMSHMHAIFHSIIPLGLCVSDLVARASNLLCESTLSSHYATLVCAKADGDGNVEICNAGHPPSILVTKDGIKNIGSTGMPIGLFCDSQYSFTSLKLNKGDVLLLFSDGLSEAFFNDVEYGIERISKIAFENKGLHPKELTDKLLTDVNNYIAGNPKKDDLSIMAIRKT